MADHLHKLTKFHSMRLVIFMLIFISLIVTTAIPESNVSADTDVCGQITVDTTWSSSGNNYIVTCLVQVNQGVRLTIQPGTRVQFNDNLSLQVYGELVAEEVIFTTNTGGNWARIYFGATSVDAVFDLDGNYLSGSKLTNSIIVYGGGSGVFGAIEVDGAAPFISGNTIRYSQTRGIYARGRLSSKPVVIQDNLISNNSDGGIDVVSGKILTNNINNNSSSQGAGILTSDSVVDGNTIANNQASNGGGGIYSSGSTITMNIIIGNHGADGGGIYSQGGLITGNTITGNSAASNWGTYGGGIYANGGTINNNIISGNSILKANFDSGYGGGIYASLSNISNNHVEANSVDPSENAFGGGIYTTGGVVSDNEVLGNNVNAGGGHLAYGGGVYADGGNVSNNEIQNNVASGGSDNQGGGVYGRLNTVEDNTISGNSANKGGAIYSYQGFVTNNTIQDNTAALNGAVFLETATATGNTLSGNSAANGGGIYGSQATITGNTFTDNSANNGGGIYAIQSTVQGNILTGNDVQACGGGLYTDAGIVHNNTISDNTSPSYGGGSGGCLIGAVDFKYNSVTNNFSSGTVGGIRIDGEPTILYNNLYDNIPYDAEVVSAVDLNATSNYWGQVACNLIPNRIYDGNDLPGLGKLTYAPSLYSPIPLNQMGQPGGLTIDVGESSATLNWVEFPIPSYGCRVPGSSEPAIQYKVYYDNDDSCAPFNGTGLAQGDSPILVSSGASLMVSGYSAKAYYFSVTVLDYLGRESAFSTGVVKPSTEKFIYLPVIRK